MHFEISNRTEEAARLGDVRQVDENATLPGAPPLQEASNGRVNRAGQIEIEGAEARWKGDASEDVQAPDARELETSVHDGGVGAPWRIGPGRSPEADEFGASALVGDASERPDPGKRRTMKEHLGVDLFD